MPLVWIVNKGTSTPYSLSKSGLGSDFINIPSSSPKQYARQAEKSVPADRIITPYQNEIRFNLDSISQDDSDILIDSKRSYKDQKYDLYGINSGSITTALTGIDLNNINSKSHRNKYKIDKLHSDNALFKTYHKTDQDGIIDSGINESHQNNMNESGNINMIDDTIEKVINGEYGDDENIHYYSVGK